MMMVALLAALAATAANTTPRSFVSSNVHRNAPVWINADDAIDANGNPRPDAFTDYELRFLDATAARLAAQQPTANGRSAEKDGCDITLSPPTDNRPDDLGVSARWADVVRKSRDHGVVSGIVTGTAVGFSLAVPQTLVTVEVDGPRHEVVYLLYPTGATTVRGRRYCGSEGWAPLPSIGDAITFVRVTPLDVSGLLFAPRGEDVIYEHDGRAVVAPRLRSDADVTRLGSFSAMKASLAPKR